MENGNSVVIEGKDLETFRRVEAEHGQLTNKLQQLQSDLRMAQLALKGIEVERLQSHQALSAKYGVSEGDQIDFASGKVTKKSGAAVPAAVAPETLVENAS